MHIRHVAVSVGLATTVVGTGLLTAPLASAGGIGGLGTAAFGNKCRTLPHLGAAQATSRGPGLAGSNLVRLSGDIPYNHCGGADINPDLFILDESETVPLNPLK
ncbi:hypothetical protein ADL21_06100 [Streptomyces albus subsp. albus]|nr:hypothetical protein ADL21_06100 [Streptomyces albus subsp. albus]